MIQSRPDDDFVEMLQRAVRARVEEEIAAAVEAAKADAEKRIRSQADAIALSILNRYEVSSRSNRIVIEVKKDVERESSRER